MNSLVNMMENMVIRSEDEYLIHCRNYYLNTHTEKQIIIKLYLLLESKFYDDISTDVLLKNFYSRININVSDFIYRLTEYLYYVNYDRYALFFSVNYTIDTSFDFNLEYCDLDGIKNVNELYKEIDYLINYYSYENFILYYDNYDFNYTDEESIR
jgi:hypothetical protein